MSSIQANDDRLPQPSATSDQEQTLAARPQSSRNPSEERAPKDTKPVPPRAMAGVSPETPALVGGTPAGADRWPSVPGYEIIAELGRGSMGVVYKARNLGLSRLVALKMIRCPAGVTEGTLSRFVDEARLVASLRHPNIIQIYEIHTSDGMPFFAMELADGGSLADRINGKPQSIRQAAQWTEILAQAIHAAHLRGIVHRDLKPANIMLQGTSGGSQESAVRSLGSAVRRLEAGDSNQETGGEEQEIMSDVLVVPADPDAMGPVLKITDFGLAKQLSDGGGRTESGMILGTPSYMAPEQAEGKLRNVGPASDVYALGAILYEMLTGRPPYAGESPLDTVLQLFQMEPVPPSRLQPKLPRDLETICLKCLAREPKKRYANGGALADDLKRFLAGEPIEARPASLSERVWKWSQRRPAVATLIVGIIGAVLAVIALVVWHHLELQSRLAQALGDERQARDEKEATNQRAGVKDLIRTGQSALERKEWDKGRAHLEQARGRAAVEPDLVDLREQIDGLLAQADRQRRDRKLLKDFQQHRNDALFHASMFSGNDVASSLDETRKSALAALTLFNAAPESQGAPTFDRSHFDAEEKAGLHAGCFELLLVLAEAVAQPRPNQTAAAARRLPAEQGLAILDGAAKLGITAKSYHLRRAQLLTWAGRDLDANHERLHAATVPADSELDRFLLGAEEYRRGNWKDATHLLESVLQTQPEHFWANYYLALCALKTQRPELATSRLTSCLAWKPDLAWLRLLRGSAWAEMNQFARAEEDFDAALKAKLPESARYGLFINRGVLRIRQGKTIEAIEDLHQAIQLRPNHYQGFVNLAQAFVKDKKLDDAVRQLDQAIEQAPKLTLLYRTRARVHLLRKDDVAALADLEQASALETNTNSTAHAEDQIERGRIVHRREDYEAAVSAYDAAIAIRPQHVRAHRLRAEALLELSRLVEALQSLDICVQHGPVDADVFRARAAVRVRLGQYAGAQTDYTRALEIEPDAVTHNARGWAYLVADAPALALRDFEEALNLDSTDGDSYSGRGCARVLLGQQHAALTDANEALRLGPASPRLLFTAARIYAQAALRQIADAKRDGQPPSALPADWQHRSVQLLQRALEMQSAEEAARFWKIYVQSDAAFQSMRHSYAFTQLANRYGPPAQ